MEMSDSKTWAAFDAYCEWLSLPRHYANFNAEQLEEKGFPSHLIDLLSIKTKKEFREKFCIGDEMLRDWDKHPELQKRIKANWKKWCKHLTPGVMSKFYEMLMKEGDAARIKVWMEHVEEESKPDNSVNLNIGFENILKSMKQDGDFNAKQI